MKKSSKVILVILVIIIISLVCLGGWFLVSSLNKSNEKINELENKITISNEDDNKSESIKNENEDNEINNLNSVNNTTTTNNKSNNTNMTKEEALKIATNVYTNAYQQMFNKEFVYGDYDIDGKKVFAAKADFNIISKYFSSKIVESFKSHLKEVNGEYYDVKEENSAGFAETLDLSTIFGGTDQGIRTLTIKNYSDNMIVATGQLVNNTEGDNDRYPLYIIFVKEGDNWLIDLYE